MKLNIFGAIADLTKGKLNEPPLHPYWLEEKDIDGLRALRASEGWPALVKLVDNVSNIYGEALLRPDNSQVDYQRGYLAGLRQTLNLVQLSIERDEHARRSKPEPRERLTGRAALYGSPGWESVGR